jgi:rod shape-determining protein MreC
MNNTSKFILKLISIFLLVVGLVWVGGGSKTQDVRYGMLKTIDPSSRLFGGVFTKVQSFFKVLSKLKELHLENQKLIEENNALKSKIGELEHFGSENDSLKKELGFVKKYQKEKLACTVVGNDPEGVVGILVLSCGADDGVEVGQAVVSEGYLVGQVSFSSKTSATVKLITSSQSAIDVKLTRTGEQGVLHGSFNSGLVTELVSTTADVRKGDFVTTAGINAQTPKDLSVGEVGEVISSASDLIKKVTVISPIDFQEIRYVHVLK